jgi:hypothetical protein
MANVVPGSVVVLFAALVIGIVVYLIQMARLLGRLGERHPQVYESLGRPSLFLNNTPRNNLLVLGWLWRGDFEGLGDTDTISRCRSVRTLLVACLCGFVCLLVLFLAMSVLVNAQAT